MSLYESPSMVLSTITALCSGVRSLIARSQIFSQLSIMHIGKRVLGDVALCFQYLVHRLAKFERIPFLPPLIIDRQIDRDSVYPSVKR